MQYRFDEMQNMIRSQRRLVDMLGTSAHAHPTVTHHGLPEFGQREPDLQASLVWPTQGDRQSRITKKSSDCESLAGSSTTQSITASLLAVSMPGTPLMDYRGPAAGEEIKAAGQYSYYTNTRTNSIGRIVRVLYQVRGNRRSNIFTAATTLFELSSARTWPHEHQVYPSERKPST